MAAEPRHRVVIVGGGFGGLFAAKFLGRAPVDVTLVGATSHRRLRSDRTAGGIIMWRRFDTTATADAV